MKKEQYGIYDAGCGIFEYEKVTQKNYSWMIYFCNSEKEAKKEIKNLYQKEMEKTENMQADSLWLGHTF